MLNNNCYKSGYKCRHRKTTGLVKKRINSLNSLTEVDVFLDADFKQILIAVKEKGPITSFRAQPMNKEIH